MRKRLQRFYRVSVIVIATMFLCTAIITDSKVYASPRDRHPPDSRHGPPVKMHHRYPQVRPLIPIGFALLTIAGMEYYYHRGIYYQQLPNRYIVTLPPTGAVIVQLPAGHIRFMTGGVEYYYYGDVYYQKTYNGYIVVPPPYEASSAVSVKNLKNACPLIEEVEVTARMLNVRSGPGKDHTVTSQIPIGTALEVHGVSPEWIFVKLPSGDFGWIMKKFTRSTSATTPIVELVPAEG